MSAIVRLVPTLSRFPAAATAPGPSAAREFHMLASARRRYGVEQAFFGFTGTVVLADFHAARLLAKRLNDARDLLRHPERAVRPGQVNAMGLLHEIQHHIVRLYERSASPGAFARATQALRAQGYDAALDRFVELYPPGQVHAGLVAPATWMRGATDGTPHAELALEELLLLVIANGNPALHAFSDLFDDRELAESAPYTEAVAALEAFFRGEPTFGPERLTLPDLLRAPILASPHSLEGQLAYMRERWGLLLSRSLLERITGAGDLIREDTRVTTGGPGPVAAPAFVRPDAMMPGAELPDAERFSDDLDWMPNVVLLAKNVFVWLDQLSKRHRLPITRLDQVPDEELDTLARWNFTGLWLIGLWERSPASREIKRRAGNEEAAGSAYSLYEYSIASDLGGEEAFASLRRRAAARGIRMAGDMVPNHMGVFSRWVVEHPEYFIQSPVSPFPSYRFTGPDLSQDPRVEVRIEDGYWTRSDAAVVFERIDARTGARSYLYHGNDGTHMPWNDTAQLNFLRSDVREAVIGEILRVAERCPIIRFDAAMTLTKRHYQRLWFPVPGTGGDIPSRADHAMAKEAFDAAFPEEFWREVVDRVGRERPDTLLLAEAFWLLEGYFVRTLGMHRVYNSAFMHMLMREDNARYRDAIRSTLHYNPEILKRYVNFMSNPDERTAIDQFGRDDKYFGTAVLMVTLPGLPMFAHGQVEGYTERYGMEYRRAYRDEWPDEHLVRRHEREIVPLLARRSVFSQVAEFELYDLVDASGVVNENVYAYSNRSGAERALVLFHNAFAEVRGRIKQSAGKAVAAGVEGTGVRSRTLGEALGLSAEEGVWYILREHVSGLEYLHAGRELSVDGLEVSLRAFEYRVFCDIREERDASGAYDRLARTLGGRGVPSVHEALRDLALQPLHDASAAFLAELPRAAELFGGVPGGDLAPRVVRRFELAVAQARRVVTGMEPVEVVLNAFTRELAAVSALLGTLPSDERTRDMVIAPHGREALLLAWAAWRGIHRLAAVAGEDDAAARRRVRLDRLWADALVRAGLTDEEAAAALVWFGLPLPPSGVSNGVDFTAAVARLVGTSAVHAAIGVNEYRGVRYYRKEAFENVLKWFYTVSVVSALSADPARLGRISAFSAGLAEAAAAILDRSEEADYRIDALERLLAGPTRPGRTTT